MIRTSLLAAVLLAGFAAPVSAQHHAGHDVGDSGSDDARSEAECEAEAGRHRAMGHRVPEGECEPREMSGMDHSSMDHSSMADDGGSRDERQDHAAMDHSAMDHGQMDHGQMDHGEMPSPSIPEAGPPPAAGSGPPRAADAIWGAEAMRESREALRSEQGAQLFSVLRADRFEYRARDGKDGYLWDLDAWFGGDLDKLWLKSEGEGAFGEDIEQAEIQALYSRAIGPWWDLQAGVRQDLVGPTRTHAVIGVQGLAPYVFEVDAAAFLSDAGDVTARIEAEVDQRITQRLVLQPRAEVNLAAQDVPELGIGAGLDSVEAGIRLRYEFIREFAPYLGIEQEWRVGRSADYARAGGEDASVTNYVVGLRFWF